MEYFYYQTVEKELRTVLKRNYLKWSPHFHSTIEIIYMHSGTSMATINGIEYPLKKDDLLVVFPNQIHGYQNDCDIQCIFMAVPTEYTTTYHNLFNNMLPECPIIHHASRFPRIIELFYHVHDVFTAKDKHKEEILHGYLTAFFGLLFNQMSLLPASQQSGSTVHNILHYCMLHYHEPLTLSFLANEMHTNRNAVSAIFSQQLHIRFTDYINSLRIEEARRLLKNTEESITAISAAVGFETIRTFNRAFQRASGMSPTEYRKAFAKY